MWTQWLERTLRKRPKESSAAPETVDARAPVRGDARALSPCHCEERSDEAIS